MHDRETVSRGLDLMFAAEIAALLTFFPIVGLIAAFAALLMGIMGLVKCAKVNSGYQGALIAHVVAMVCAFLPLGFLSRLVATVCSFLSVYFVCAATDEEIVAEGLYGAQSLKGSTVWKLHLGCDIAALACALLVTIPLLNVLAAIGAIGVAVTNIVAGILYIVYLYRSSKLLA